MLIDPFTGDTSSLKTVLLGGKQEGNGGGHILLLFLIFHHLEVKHESQL